MLYHRHHGPAIMAGAGNDIVAHGNTTGFKAFAQGRHALQPVGLGQLSCGVRRISQVSLSSPPITICTGTRRMASISSAVPKIASKLRTPTQKS